MQSQTDTRLGTVPNWNHLQGWESFGVSRFTHGVFSFYFICKREKGKTNETINIENKMPSSIASGYSGTSSGYASQCGPQPKDALSKVEYFNLRLLDFS